MNNATDVPRLFHCRVGSPGDKCDICHGRIEPHQLAYALSDGRLICQDCKFTHFHDTVAQ